MSHALGDHISPVGRPWSRQGTLSVLQTVRYHTDHHAGNVNTNANRIQSAFESRTGSVYPGSLGSNLRASRRNSGSRKPPATCRRAPAAPSGESILSETCFRSNRPPRQKAQVNSYRLEATPSADLDVEATFDWYEGEEPGLGSAFLDELRETYQRIMGHPLGYQDLRSGIRRALTRRFPYAIYFSIERETVVIVAVLSTARDPAEWQRRI